MDKPAISIIMPIYNGECFLRECLDSVLSQTLERIQVLCIDDGSTDSSAAILQEYAARDSRVQILQQKNQGAGPARNLGMKEARGEFIFFMDCDDFYPNSQTLQRMYDSAKSTLCQIAGGYHVDVKGDVHTPNPQDPVYQWALKTDAPKALRYRDVQCDRYYQSFLFSTELLRRNNLTFPDYLRGEDPPFLVRAMDAAQKFCLMPEITYCYRVGEKTVSWTPRKICDYMKSNIELLELSEERQLDILHAKVASRLEKNFFNLILENVTLDNPQLTCLICIAGQKTNVLTAQTHDACKSGHLALMDGLAARLANLWNGCIASAALASETDLSGVIMEQIGILTRTWAELGQTSPAPIHALIGDALAALFQPDKLYLTRQTLHTLISSGKAAPFVRACGTDAHKVLQSVRPAFAFYDRYLHCEENLNCRVVHQAAPMESPDVSVIIPVYNVQPYLKECLDSVVHQKGVTLEIICVDDGSTDGSPAILEEYALKYPNITVLRQNNGGQSAARNAGIQMAQGRYIHFLDSDDTMCENAYAPLVTQMDADKLQILYFNGDSFFETEELRRAKRWYQTAYSKNQVDTGAMTGAEYYIHCQSHDKLVVQPCMYLTSREYLRRVGIRFPAGIVYEDNLFTLLTMISARRVSHVSRSLYRRRVREGSTTITAMEFRHAFGCYYTGQELLRWTQTHTDLPEVTRQLLRNEANGYYRSAINRMTAIKDTPQREYYLALPDAGHFYTTVYVPFEARAKDRAAKPVKVNQRFDVYRRTVNRWKIAADSGGSSLKKAAKQVLPAGYQKIDQQSDALLAVQQKQTELLLNAMEFGQERSWQMQEQVEQLLRQVQQIQDQLTRMQLSD